MATQTLEFSAGTGLTLLCKLFAIGSDAIVATQAATEKSNDKNRYSVAFTDVPAGAYRLNAFVDTKGGFANEVYDLTLTTATFQPRSEAPGVTASEVADAVWDETLTGATHNVATSAGRRLRTLADTVILKDGDTVAADNAGEINGSNGLGRIKLQPDVGTVCVGQAVRVAGQVRYIEAYDADTQYATVDSGWCSIPEVGDEYTIFNLRNALIQRIASAGSGTIAYPIAKLWEMLEDSSGYRFTEKALEEAPTGGGGSGTGSFTINLVVKLGNGNTVGDCDVSLTTSSTSSTTNLIASARTNPNGEVTFQLDSGVFYVWRQKLGVNFDNPVVLTVAGDGSATVS